VKGILASRSIQALLGVGDLSAFFYARKDMIAHDGDSDY
jgi:hypothetical protein